MMPELDEPFGRHRWDPLAEIETLVIKDADGGEEMPAPDATS